MPLITDETGTTLNPLGDFSGTNNDVITFIIDFCMPRALFSIRRTSSNFLHLSKPGDNIPYIEQCLLRTCISDHLSTSMFNGAAPQPVHQWTYFGPPIQTIDGKTVFPKLLSNFGLYQEIAFNSPHAVDNYSVAQRITLAWSYDSMSISQVLDVNNFGNTPLEAVVANENISYMMNPTNYYYNPTMAPIPIQNNDLAMQTLAYLGVTQAEFNKIPLQIRQFIILNQITVNREEIDCIIDKKNKALFLNANLINSIKQLIAMSPTIQQIGGNVPISVENSGNLIKPKLSSFCTLYKQGSNRTDYLVAWLKNHLQSLGIYQDPTQHMPTSISVNETTYNNIKQELDYVIDLLKSDYLTADDIEASKANGYDLYMLQAKIERVMEKQEEENRTNAALMFSNNLHNAPTFASVQQSPDEFETVEHRAYSHCIIQ